MKEAEVYGEPGPKVQSKFPLLSTMMHSLFCTLYKGTCRVCHTNQWPTMRKVIRKPEAVLWRGQDPQGFDRALFPREDLLSLTSYWDQPNLNTKRVAQDQEQGRRIA